MGGRGGGGCVACQYLPREPVEGLSAAPVLQTAGAALANVSLEKLPPLLRAVVLLKYLTGVRSGSLCVGVLGKARAGRRQKSKIWAVLAQGWCWGLEEESGGPLGSLA